MAKNYLIGVDLGTSATKAALYRTDGSLVTDASIEVPLYTPEPGVVEQENEDFYRSAARAVNVCLSSSGIEPRSVAAIAFDSQMAGIGSVDENFLPVTRYDSWLDMRCKPYIDQLESQHGDVVTRLTGCPPTCNHGPKMMWWKGERPESYARIAKFITPAGYVAGRMAGLSGDRAFIDTTFLHFTALSDAEQGSWSPQLCDLLGVDRQKLPRIVDPWEVVGEVRPKAAKDFGLAPGTPIAAGAGDTAAGALGAGIVRPGMLLDTAGTAAVLAGCTDRFVADQQHRTLLIMRSVIPGLWHPLAYIAGGGLAIRWFRDLFFGDAAGTDSRGDRLFDEMSARAAELSPGVEGLFFNPHLGGRICPAAPEMRGAWVGFSWKHRECHFFRAILESVAYEYAGYLDILHGMIPDLDLFEARVIGGGARNKTWNQIKADVLGIPYQRLGRSEFATWGCALIAGFAVGLFDDLAGAAAETTVPKGAAVLPRCELTRRYRPFVEQYKGWQDQLGHGFRSPPTEPTQNS